MIKNISRKGIAFGAIAALGLAGLTGVSPATAGTVASDIIGLSYVGTGTSIIEGTDFVATTTPAALYNFQNRITGDFSIGDYEQYNRWVWTDASSDYWQLQTGSVYAEDHLDENHAGSGVGGGANNIFNSDGTNNNDSTADFGDYYLSDLDGNDDYIPGPAVRWFDDSDKAAASQNGSTVTFALTDPISADTTVKFNSYIDKDRSSSYTIGDPLGAEISIKFLDNYAHNVLNVALTGTYAGLQAQDLKASVSAAAGVNLSQLSDDVVVHLYKGGFLDGSSVNYAGDPDVVIPWTTTDANVGEYSAWTNKGTAYYTARAFLFATTDVEGDDVYFPNTAFALSALSSEAIVGQIQPDSKVEGITIVHEANANRRTDGVLRSGTKSFDISAQVLTADGADDDADTSDSFAMLDNYLKSGLIVKFKARVVDDVDNSEIKVGTTVLTSSWQDVAAPTTDANGVAKITVTSKNADAGDHIEVTAYTIFSNGQTFDRCEHFRWEDTYLDRFYETHGVGYSQWGNGETLAAKQNGQVTLTFVANDQFGQPFARSGYDYQVVVFDDESWTRTFETPGAALVNGKATVSFNNQEVVGRTYTVEADVEYRRSGTEGWTYSDYSDYTEITVVNDKAVGALSLKSDVVCDDSDCEVFNNNITTDDFITWNDEAADWETTTLVEPNDDFENYLHGQVVDVNNVPLGGQAVTISSPGVQFTDDNVYVIGSITVYTDENGEYSVEYFTHKAGVNTFTATTGGKSATVDETFKDVTLLHATDVLTVVAPKAVKNGTTTSVSVKLVDKFGNGIQGALIALGLVGEGYLTSYSVTTEKGAANVSLITGMNDDAASTITAATNHATTENRISYIRDDGDVDYVYSNGANQHYVNKSFIQAVTTGSAATAIASSAKGRLTVDVDNSRGETIRVYVDGKRVALKVANKDHFKFNVNKLKKGKHKISVSSDFQTLVAKSVTIK